MKVFAIGDLHLPGNDVKPMNVFGEQWDRHFERISEDWRRRVEPEDLVLVPGDISWAMHLKDALGDLEAIGHLPGRKVLLRGNHDYWWSSISRVREALLPGCYALQNDSLVLDGVAVCGTRGWVIPGEPGISAEDDRIYARELLRLEMTLRSARSRADGRPLIAMMHFPPLMENRRDTGFTRLLEGYGVAHVVYGHLHGKSLASAFRGALRGVCYHQVSCDGLGFRLYQLAL